MRHQDFWEPEDLKPASKKPMKFYSSKEMIIVGVVLSLAMLYSCAMNGYDAMSADFKSERESLEKLRKPVALSPVASNASVWGVIEERVDITKGEK